jgi:FkbH-like protein
MSPLEPIANTLVFLHIPKTGGVTLENILLRNFRPREVFCFGSHQLHHGGGHRRSVAWFHSLPPERRARVRLLAGHMAYGAHELVGHDCDYITLLRSPVERVVSFYNFVRSEAGAAHPAAAAARSMSLHKFVASEAHPFVTNGQTRILAGDRSWRAWEGEIGQVIPPDELLSRARRNLESCRVVGLTERYDDFLLMCQHELGWADVGYAKANVTPSRDSFPPESVADLGDAATALILEKNRLDAEIYEVARKLALERLTALESAGVLARARQVLTEQKEQRGRRDWEDVEIEILNDRLRTATHVPSEQRNLAACLYLNLFRTTWAGSGLPAIGRLTTLVRGRAEHAAVSKADVSAALTSLEQIGWIGAEENPVALPMKDPARNRGRKPAIVRQLKSLPVRTDREYQTRLADLLKEVKLVIWDLDNTFWEGVLLEDTMTYVRRNHDLVVALSKAGIINSVCSHNPADRAQAILKEHGILEYFFFPQIGYGSKGLMVKDLLDAAKLRPQNVLFIDDHPRLRAEVQDANPGVSAVPPEYLAPLDATLVPETDPDLRRLRQYRLIEDKLIAQRASALSNDDFLRMSQIVVTESSEPHLQKERILELINRTNQLNFTKARLTEEELDALLSGSDHQLRSYFVRDRYGDYGLCGFAALNVGDNRLSQFVFSCRVLGMGIEQYVFSLLGQPKLAIQGEVASRIDERIPPDWITLVRGGANGAEASEGATEAQRGSVLLKGGCDLHPTAAYLRTMTHGRWRVATELHRQAGNGRTILWQEHTDVIRLALEAREGRPIPEAIKRLPWLDEECWTTAFASPQHDVFVLSLLQDFGCGTYALNDGSATVPYEYFGIDITNPAAEEALFTVGKERCREFGLTRELLAWFRSSFTFVGPISEERLADNLSFILSRLPDSATLVLINGAEVDVEDQAYPFDSRQVDRHRQMNAALGKLLDRDRRLRLVDVRQWVKTAADVGDRLFHYNRSVYSRIAETVQTHLP